MIVTIFDTETTGLIENPARRLSLQPEIISIAILNVNLAIEETSNKYYQEFCPTKSIEHKITEITGFTNDYLKTKPPIFLHLDEIIARLMATGIIIGQNITFDKSMVELECQRYNKEIFIWPRIIDLVENSIHLKGYRLNLTNLHLELFGTTFESAHNAMVDVEATAKCAIEMFKRGML